MTERKIFEKHPSLSEDKLNTKSSKNVYVKNDVISTVIKRCRGVKEIGRIRKKLMIPEFQITECTGLEVKPKIGIIFVYENILEEYSIKIYKIDHYL